MSRITVLILAGAILTGDPALVSASDLKVTLLQTPKLFWREFMKAFYGPYDRQKKCWVSKVADQRYCMRPHRLDQVKINGKNNAFLVIGGSRMDESGELEQTHASTGVMGLVLLRAQGQDLAKVAQNSLYEDFGTFGVLPPEDQFQVREIGPNATFGWVATGGWSGSGISVASTTIYAPIGDTVAAIGRVPQHFDEQGNCDGGRNLTTGLMCSDYSFELMFDSQDTSQRFYPIILRLSGSRAGVQYDQSFVVRFDPKKFRYEDVQNLPAGMEEDG